MYKPVNSSNKKVFALVLSMSTLVILLSLIVAFLYNYSDQLQGESEYDASLAYHNLIDEIQDFTNQNISLLSGFSAYVQTNESFTDEEIYTYLDYLLKDNLDDIRNVGIFKDTTITWIYPLEGNESAIGVDLSKVPAQADAISKVKGEGVTLFVGPVDLVQGGVGFIIRMPLSKDNAYWGMVSIVLRAEQAFEFIDDYSDEHNMDYLITHANNTDEIIYGNKEILKMSPLKFVTEESLGGWDVYTVPTGGWNNHMIRFASIFVICGLISVGISERIYRWVIEYNLILTDKIELEKKYILDRFTGIYTREYFNLRVQEEFSHSRRHGHAISMIYFDLDHFKKVNDEFGHAAGDKVLLKVVDCVKKVIRTEDVFSRWGGDEFILLLPFTELKEAEFISERIRTEIESLEISQLYGVTASVGCSQWTKMEYLESWFARTDKALYTSKNTGKNKVTVNDHERETDILVKVVWDNAWNCNHPVIDEEHRSLLDRCNSIIESSLGKASFNETLRNVDAFLQEIEQHFASEIAILEDIGYPHVNEHENLHNNILKRSREIYDKTFHNNITSVELFSFLLNEVVESHLRNEDVKYFKYIKM